MDGQKIVAIILITVVVVYGVWLVYRAFKSKGGGSCNCSGGCK